MRAAPWQALPFFSNSDSVPAWMPPSRSPSRRFAPAILCALAIIALAPAAFLPVSAAPRAGELTTAARAGAEDPEAVKAAKDARNAERARARRARRSARREASAGVVMHGVSISAGWAMGLAFDPIDPGANSSKDVPGAEKQDLAPFFHLSANFGDGSECSTEVKLVLANFGRLVNKLGVNGFSEDSSGTSVRRAVITDFTVRTPVLSRWSGNRGGILWNIVNAGFSLDAQGYNSGTPLDAASYWFTGPTIMGHSDDLKFIAAADLLVGTSELLTGVESFDFHAKKKYPVRIRPRTWFHFAEGLGHDRPLDLGFWGDLGPSNHSADAVTVFISTTLMSSAKPSESH